MINLWIFFSSVHGEVQVDVLEILILNLLVPTSLRCLCLWAAVLSGGILASVKQLKDVYWVVI